MGSETEGKTPFKYTGQTWRKWTHLLYVLSVQR